MYPVRPEGWVCRSCCRFWEWTYRPPSEPELDEPCVKCGEVLELQERAVEVQRLTLKHLLAGRTPMISQVVTQVAQVESAASVESQPPEPGSGVACTVEEAGRRLGCKRTMVFQLLKTGRLVAAPKLGRQRMVLTASVDELLAAGGVGAARDARPAQSRPQKARSTNGKSLAAEIAKLPVE
jgi:excisionase family DNA binding protein